VRKIKASELSAILNSCSVIGCRSFFWTRKTTKPNLLPFNRNLGSPRERVSTESYSFEPTGICNFLLLISTVLRMIRPPKVLFPIIQRVMVFVVHFSTTMQHYFVHENPTGLTPWIVSCGIKRFRTAIPVGMPIPPVQPTEVIGIYDSVLPLSQWNESVGCVERLDNCVSLHAALHRSSFKGPFDFSRYSLTENGNGL